MKLLVNLLLSSTLLFSVGAQADDWLRSVPEFELTDHLGNSHSLEDYKQYDYVAFYVQGVGCPIARIAIRFGRPHRRGPLLAVGPSGTVRCESAVRHRTCEAQEGQ